MLDFNQRKNIESIELKLKSLEPAAISKARLSDSIKLNEHINYYFKNSEKKYNVTTVITSCANEPGEGEHKLYHYIRCQEI